MENSSARLWRVRLWPLLGAFILFRYVLFAEGAHRLWGYRIFFLGSLGLIVSLWLMDRKDLRHLQEQERLAAENPKHLVDISAGLKANPSERFGVVLGLACMGTGLLVAAFPLSHIGLIFGGTACCLLAISLWALT